MHDRWLDSVALAFAGLSEPPRYEPRELPQDVVDALAAVHRWRQGDMPLWGLHRFVMALADELELRLGETTEDANNER
jgi:hypothetical protein